PCSERVSLSAVAAAVDARGIRAHGAGPARGHGHREHRGRPEAGRHGLGAVHRHGAGIGRPGARVPSGGDASTARRLDLLRGVAKSAEDPVVEARPRGLVEEVRAHVLAHDLAITGYLEDASAPPVVISTT